VREITIVKTNNLSSSIDEVLTMAETNARVNTKPTYIIVPDRFTLEAERKLLKISPCLLNTRVLTFTMLYNLITSETETQPNILDKTKAVLFMWHAIESVRDSLVWFNKSSGHYTFAEKMFNTINQLTSSLVDFENLEKNAHVTITRKKMHDISLIYKKYCQITQDYTDSAGMLGFLIKEIKSSLLIKDASIYMCGFEHLSIQRLAVVNELIKHAAQTTIGIKEKSELEDQLTPMLFELKDVKIHNVQAKVNDRIVNLYSQNTRTKLDNVYVLQYKTPHIEAAHIANQVRGLLNNGINPNDIKVLLCDYENTYQIFEQFFNHCNVPLNLDVGIPLVKTSLAIFFRDILALANHDTAETFIPILKSKYININPKCEFQIENFCIKTNFGLSSFLEKNDLEIEPETKHSLENILRFIKEISKSKTIMHFSDGLLQLAKTLEIEEDSIEKICLDKTISILEVLGQVIGEKSVDVFEYSNLFATLTVATKISTIPTYANRVILVNSTEYQPSFVPYLFIANIHDGVFPVTRPDTDILTELDIRAMAVTIEPTVTMQNIRSRNQCLDTLSSFTEKLFLSTVATNTLNEEVNTSEIIARILELDLNAELEYTQINSKHFAMNQVLQSIGNDTAFSDMVHYNSILQSVGLESFEIPNLHSQEFNIRNGKNLFAQNECISVTTLESFFSCPYYNFLTKGLRLRERPRYRVGSDVMGNLIHKIIEEYTEEFIRQKNTPTDAQLSKIIGKAFENTQFKYFTNDPNNKPLVELLKKEIRILVNQINAQISTSSYKPKYVEKSLSQKTGDITLIGKVDRVDTMLKENNKHAFVIDYKTGSNVDFKLRDVYTGTKLQLPLYSDMLSREGYTADGAAYFQLKSGLSKETKLKGIIDYTSEEIESVMNYAKHIATDAIKHMKDGVIKKASISEKVCGYCPAKALCSQKENTRANNVPIIKPVDFGGIL